MRKNDVEMVLIYQTPQKEFYYITKDKQFIKKKQLTRSVITYNLIDCDITEQEKEYIREHYGTEEELYQEKINYCCHKEISDASYEGLKEMIAKMISNDAMVYERCWLDLLKMELSFKYKIKAFMKNHYINSLLYKRIDCVNKIKEIDRYLNSKFFSKINITGLSGKKLAKGLRERMISRTRDVRIATAQLEDDVFLVNGIATKQSRNTVGWYCYKADIEGIIQVGKEK